MRRRDLKTTTSVLAYLLGFFSFAVPAAAQTIQVDITPAHSTNRFVPNETLGAGVDRIPAAAIDKGSASADSRQGVRVRMATRDLSPEHGTGHGGMALEPEGNVERSGGKGYFMGSASPRPFVIPMDIRCRIAESRATTEPKTPDIRGSQTVTATYWKSNPYLTQRTPAKAMRRIRNGSFSISRS